MKKKIFIALFFIFSSSFLASCLFFETCNPAPDYFQINGLDSNLMRFTNEGLNPWELIQTSESIDWDEFFIRFYFDVTYIAQLDISWGNQLMAYSCPEPGELGAKTGIDTLYFITPVDYNENFTAGDTLNQILLLNSWIGRTEDFNNFYTPAEFVRQNDEIIMEQSFEVKLSEPPAKNGDYFFQLVYHLDNGKSFVEATNPVMINIE